MRSRDGSGCRRGNPACATQVADAIITWPLFLSTAITDQVAHAGACVATTITAARKAFFISRALSSGAQTCQDGCAHVDEESSGCRLLRDHAQAGPPQPTRIPACDRH